MTLGIVQARLGSSRLPRKALMEIGGGAIIQRVIDRAKQVRGVDRVVLACPAQDASGFGGVLSGGNAIIVVSCPEDDVLQRFALVLERYPNHDTVMRITGDCPLIDPLVCERVLALYRSTPGCEYAWTNTRDGEWPDGLDCEVFSASALRRAHRDAKHPSDREHVTSWIRRHHTVGGRTVGLPPDPVYRGWPKVSVDTLEDLERVRQMVEGC